MQGRRANTGNKTTPMSGKLATKLTGGGQPRPVASRPQPATPAGAPRAGSRVVVSVDGGDLAEAGKQTGSPPEPAQQVKPVLGNANTV